LGLAGSGHSGVLSDFWSKELSQMPSRWFTDYRAECLLSSHSSYWILDISVASNQTLASHIESGFRADHKVGQSL